MAIKPKVLFLCTENSCRTQMAEAFLRELTGDELEIVSAGRKPATWTRKRCGDAGGRHRHLVGTDQERLIRTSVNDFTTSSRYATDRRSGRARYSLARSGARNGRLRARPRWRQWHDHGVAVRHARDKIRRHVDEFVEKHHHPKSGKGKSTWT